MKLSVFFAVSLVVVFSVDCYGHGRLVDPQRSSIVEQFIRQAESIRGACECGKYNPKSSGRIVGGKEVDPHRRYPWQVGLRADGYQIECGGSIISDRWILTAAHCIFIELGSCYRIEKAQYKVLVGEHNQDDGNGDYLDTNEHRIKEMYPHQKYQCRTTSLNYDFALLELHDNDKIIIGRVIQPICLPTNDWEYGYDWQRGIVTGWGLTEAGTLSSFLKEVNAWITPDDTCNAWENIQADESGKMCAFNNDVYGHGPCKADSGGPLAVLQNNKYYQVGVVSYGNDDCTTSEYPLSVYGRVTKALDWIKLYTNINCG